MYPPTHPAIQAALARISEASKHATFNGPFSITVLPDTLLVGGRGFAKPEAIGRPNWPTLLHQQLIIEMTLFDRLDNDGLARVPDAAGQVAGRRARRRRRGQGVGGDRATRPSR